MVYRAGITYARKYDGFEVGLGEKKEGDSSVPDPPNELDSAHRINGTRRLVALIDMAVRGLGMRVTLCTKCQFNDCSE